MNKKKLKINRYIAQSCCSLMIIISALFMSPAKITRAESSETNSPISRGISQSEMQFSELDSSVNDNIAAAVSIPISNDNVGFYHPSQFKWYLKNNTASGWNGLKSFRFGGIADMIPLAGDWNGDGRDTVGFYIPSQYRWYLKGNQEDGWNSLTTFSFGGPAEMIPVAGDWDGDGVDTVGFYIPGQFKWYLKNNQTDGWTGITSFRFGGSADMTPITGDWNGNGVDTVGFYIPGQYKWYLKNNQSDGWTGITSFSFGGPAEMTPVAGDWDGDGVDTVGFYIPVQYKWYLKDNQIDGWNGITSFGFGGSAEMIPVVGNWGPPYTIPVSERFTPPANSTGTYSVSCPPNSVVISGGYYSGIEVHVYEHFKSGNGWQVSWKNYQSSHSFLDVRATCLTNIPDVTVTEVIDEATVYGGGSGFAEAQCPAGTTLTGGGWDIPDDNAYRVFRSDSFSNKWRVSASSEAMPSTIKSYAYCLSGINVSSDQVSITKSITAGDKEAFLPRCLVGETIGGGGFSIYPDNDLAVEMNASRPDDAEQPDDQDEWYVIATNTGSVDEDLTAYAVCLSFP